MKKEVILCDMCENKIAKFKCALCNRDLCEDNNCSTGLFGTCWRKEDYFL